MHDVRYSLAPLTLSLIAILLVGCNNGRSTQSGSSMAHSSRPIAELDLGDDWEAQAASRRSGTRAGSSSGDGWSIVLGTFSGDGHAEQARGAQQQIASNVPELASTSVRSTERGSMLLYGNYASADDAIARRDLDRIKQITINNQPVFLRAFLTPARAGRTAQPRSSYDLMAVREQRPNMHPLYTLQVAVWGDFESGTLSVDEIRRRAEAYMQQLRVQGFEAYVHHENQQSHVTVGIFDRTALDEVTGGFGPELVALSRRFSAHLVNGEELLEPIDRRRPDRGTQAQRPFLVLVPRLR